MKKRKTFKFKPVFLLVAAAILLLASTVGSTQAALTYYSENYKAEVKVANIGVSLLEKQTVNEETKDVIVASKNYLTDDNVDNVKKPLFSKLLKEGEKFVLGKDYEEVLKVQNTGAIDTYVRVIITKSWQHDKDADKVYEKDTTLKPSYIGLNLLTGDNGWMVDDAASTHERTVLYYKNILKAATETAEGEITTPFTDFISISPEVGKKVIETIEKKVVDSKEYQTIRMEYEYDNYKFIVDVEVDAVQTHNAKDAIKSAWGVDVNVAEDGSISLN